MWYEDKIELYVPGEGSHDENFNPVRIPESWFPLGDCKIHGNSSAKTVPAADGKTSSIAIRLQCMFLRLSRC